MTRISQKFKKDLQNTELRPKKKKFMEGWSLSWVSTLTHLLWEILGTAISFWSPYCHIYLTLCQYDTLSVYGTSFFLVNNSKSLEQCGNIFGDAAKHSLQSGYRAAHPARQSTPRIFAEKSTAHIRVRSDSIRILHTAINSQIDHLTPLYRNAARQHPLVAAVCIFCAISRCSNVFVLAFHVHVTWFLWGRFAEIYRAFFWPGFFGQTNLISTLFGCLLCMGPFPPFWYRQLLLDERWLNITPFFSGIVFLCSNCYAKIRWENIGWEKWFS